MNNNLNRDYGHRYIVVEVPTYIKGELLQKVKNFLASRFKNVKHIEVKPNDSLIYGFKAYVIGHTVKTVTFDITNLLRANSRTPLATIIESKEFGEVASIDSEVAVVKGLYDVAYGELVTFIDTNIKGLVIDLLEDAVGVIILGEYSKIKTGDKVVPDGESLSIRVGKELLGRHINPIGQALDGQRIDYKDFKRMPIEAKAANVLQRKPVDRPLFTGIMAIDSMIPIGRGQRELIIGDRQTGKSSIALDTILFQKGQDVICVYVSIGQQAQKIARTVELLEEYQALDHTILVTATASDPASLQYLAPYSGMAIAEYFAKQGEDVLIIFDDLTKHAWAYRQISLLLKRPAGREAYPGDIFYLHSRLLERAVQYSDDLGGGSITALPIIETQAQDVSAYIPTNVISITDGQIYLDLDLFNSGIKPAVNIGLSVSRVGSSAQPKIIKSVAKSLRLILSQYRELESFAQLGAKLDTEAQTRLQRGRALIELLKQDLHVGYTPELQASLIFIGQSGLLDNVPSEHLPKIKLLLLERIPQTLWFQKLDKNKPLDKRLQNEIIESIKPFIEEYVKSIGA